VNYRAVGRARSRREFIAKLSIVAEEIDETVFWLELICDCGICTGPDLDAIVKEPKNYCTYSLLPARPQKITP
jgi:four helix bundle protein